ncbi:MAG: hypothetical protein IJ760_00250 [Bacteroidales bacterium]|nr:hypothetical protein [Bacteroidales bacterium]
MKKALCIVALLVAGMSVFAQNPKQWEWNVSFDRTTQTTPVLLSEYGYWMSRLIPVYAVAVRKTGIKVDACKKLSDTFSLGPAVKADALVSGFFEGWGLMGGLSMKKTLAPSGRWTPYLSAVAMAGWGSSFAAEVQAHLGFSYALSDNLSVTYSTLLEYCFMNPLGGLNYGVSMGIMF